MRFVDGVEPSRLQDGKEAIEQADAAEEQALPRERPDGDALQTAVASEVDKNPAVDAQVETDATQTAALPTGADKSGVTSQAISTPKGSGTIQGMGESFSAQLSTGIATFSVPFSLPAARGGAQPSLGLSYSSGSGAGLAGMGWSVGVPFIARQTDRGLPGYDDQAEWHPNQDRFVFNGGQELVPLCVVRSETVCETPGPAAVNALIAGELMPPWAAGHQYFRPRVEGSFLRFFWAPNHLTWRVQDKSGVTMELGVPLDGSGSHAALEVNPDAEKQIYRWHLVRQYDTYGEANTIADDPKPVNVVVYRYTQDGGQAYLSDIYDTTPAAAPTTTVVADYAHHTRLEYEPRSDPTESYRSGWLMKQTRRLKRVDVTSKTASSTSAARRLVRRYHLEYDAKFHTSYLASVQVEGRCATTEAQATPELDGVLGDTDCVDVAREDNFLPPMTFEYSHVSGFTTAGSAVESSLAGYEAFDARLMQMGGDPPHSVDEELTDYFDINRDALPDVLVTAPGTYGNDFGVFFNSQGGTPRTFGAVTQLGVAGVLGANSGSIKLSNPNVAPLDFDGDGLIDFLHMPKVKTYSAYTPKVVAGKWMLVGRAIDAASKQSPKIDFGHDTAETRVVDVNFDGLVDVVVSTGTEFQTFLSLGRLPGGDGQFGDGKWQSKDTASLSNEPIGKCVPYSGTPVRFSDSDVQLADMNGDGIQDILRLRRGDFRYWPGRGDGFWGTGKLNDCPAGSFGDKRYVTMEGAPYYSDIQGTSLRVDDVNGDGLDDLVQVRFDAIDVWLNVDGKRWTKRSIVDGTPHSPSFANRVRLMDINGSGTRDIVWGNGKKYQFMDLAGGERPGLLVSVENGLGKSTSIDYESSTQQMLAAERGGECSGDTTSFAGGWCSKAPTVAHVVKRVTESDNLDVPGLGVGRYVTEYTYRDPVFEGRQREFRGFKRARSKRIGDANSPTDFTESTFLLGECEDETPNDSVDDCAVSERWRDNPKEALKGLPVVTERYDENGVYLSTESSTYRLRHLYDGLDGRAVRHAFQSKKRTTLYDTAPGASLAAGTDEAAVVELEAQPPPAVTDLGNRLCKVDPAQPGTSLPAATLIPTHATTVPLRATSGHATIESASYVDAFGNQLIGVAKGCVAGSAGSACPTAVTGIVADEQICSFSDAILPAGQETNWLYRSATSWVRGSVQTDVRKRTTTSYSAQGAPTKTVATLSGTIALDRFHELGPTRIVSPTPPATAAQDGERVLGHREYDEFGNLETETGPTDSEGVSLLGRCRKVTYDVANYKQLPMSETVFTRGCDVGGLTTIAGYDRGLGLVTTVTDMNDTVTTVTYDGFGRLTALLRPSASALSPGEVPLPSVKISYSLPSPQDRRPYSVIHTQSQDGALESADQYLESYAFIDGMGRSRVGLSEADTSTGDEGSWIVSAVAEFDAKGAVRRKYLPFFLNATPPAYPLSAAPDTRYGRQRYDAFGRQVQTYDVDGTVTLQSRYHALSTDLYDAADLYPGPHQGSFASTRTDGHGRTIETTERVHEGGTLDQRYVRTQFLPSGEPTVITRYRAGSLPVVRWMRYDSLGRMVLNVDPHATANFNPDPLTSATPAPSGLKTWRYAYNDAGDLVGTSDARGCGQNFYYDGAGRLYGEDYSPCIKEHTLYSSPSVGSTPYDVASLPSSNGLEVFYQYDASPLAPVAPPPTDQSYTTSNLQGRLAAVHDRAATTWFSYDARGRGTSTWRKVSIFGTNVNTAPSYAANIGTRYTTKWFHKEQSYDAADRPIGETTGASSSELLANDEKSAVSTAYTRRGTLRNVSSSYGPLVSSIDRSADGLVGELVFADAAGTTTTMRYDSRRRLKSVQTSRSVPPQWSSPPASYSPAPSLDPNTPTTFQLLLQDLDYTYDVVGNPTEVRDWRTPEEWPEGAKPVSRRFEYDDLYRLTRVDYTYPRGGDKWKSPYAPELAGVADQRRAAAPPHQSIPSRPKWQTYRFDWLGNTTQTDDDLHAYYDRSLGNVANNVTSNPNTSKPYQLINSTALASNAWTGQTSTVFYDAAGNLLGLRAQRQEGQCVGGNCYTRLWYIWDEVGRLLFARRFAGTDDVYLWNSYDANDQRVHKLYERNLTDTRTTLYVFDSLEARRTTYDAASQQYVVDAASEVAYLSANGMRLARLHYEPLGKGEPRLETPGALHDPQLHVMLNLPDHLGSSNLIIDHATSELVEARTYQPYGATESDYRAERWKGFREDYGFTGKEEDTEVGLQYFGKRYLSPYLGRWISADPLAVHAPGQADLNLYAYVKGMVLKAIDPLGLDVYAEQGEGPAQQTGNATTLPTVTIFATDTPSLSDLRNTGRLDAQAPDSGDLFDSDGQLNFERPEIKPAPDYPPSNLASSRPNAFEKGVVNALAQLPTEPVLGLLRSLSDQVPAGLEPIRPFADGDDVLGGLFVNGLTLGLGFGSSGARAALQAPKLVLNPRLSASSRLAAPTLEITESELQLYGPFKHGINNHQIDSVLSQSVLRSETRSSVWAVEGSFDKLNMSKLNVPFVEFYTLEAPIAIDPASVQFRNGIEILITKSVRPGEAVVTHGNF